MAEALKHLDQAVEADERAKQLGEEFETQRSNPDNPGFMMNEESYRMAEDREAAGLERDANLWRGAVAEGSASYPTEAFEYSKSQPTARDYLAAGANTLLSLQVSGPLSEEDQRRLDADLWRLEEADSAGRGKAA
jgi:hypothetical protein